MKKERRRSRSTKINYVRKSVKKNPLEKASRKKRDKKKIENREPRKIFARKSRKKNLRHVARKTVTPEVKLFKEMKE